MSITITNLANSSAVAKTFTLVGRDRNTSEWVNTSDTGFDTRLLIKTQIAKNQGANPVRRTLVSVITKVPAYASEHKIDKGEQVTVNFTITAPERQLNEYMTLGVKLDAVAFLENFLSNTTVEQLLRGEV